MSAQVIAPRALEIPSRVGGGLGEISEQLTALGGYDHAQRSSLAAHNIGVSALYERHHDAKNQLARAVAARDGLATDLATGVQERIDRIFETASSDGIHPVYAYVMRAAAFSTHHQHESSIELIAAADRAGKELAVFDDSLRAEPRSVPVLVMDARPYNHITTFMLSGGVTQTVLGGLGVKGYTEGLELLPHKGDERSALTWPHNFTAVVPLQPETGFGVYTSTSGGFWTQYPEGATYVLGEGGRPEEYTRFNKIDPEEAALQARAVITIPTHYELARAGIMPVHYKFADDTSGVMDGRASDLAAGDVQLRGGYQQVGAIGKGPVAAMLEVLGSGEIGIGEERRSWVPSKEFKYALSVTADRLGMA